MVRVARDPPRSASASVERLPSRKLGCSVSPGLATSTFSYVFTLREKFQPRGEVVSNCRGSRAKSPRGARQGSGAARRPWFGQIVGRRARVSRALTSSGRSAVAPRDQARVLPTAVAQTVTIARCFRTSHLTIDAPSRSYTAAVLTTSIRRRSAGVEPVASQIG